MTEESKYTLQVKGIMNSQKRGLYLEIQHAIFLPLKGKKGTQLRINEPYAKFIE